jgi:hypothetical protein
MVTASLGRRDRDGVVYDDREEGGLYRWKPEGPKPRPGQDSLITAETSLIARFNSLLGRKKFPVPWRRELLCNSLIPLAYLERLTSLGGLNEQNSLQIPS